MDVVTSKERGGPWTARGIMLDGIAMGDLVVRIVIRNI